MSVEDKLREFIDNEIRMNRITRYQVDWLEIHAVELNVMINEFQLFLMEYATHRSHCNLRQRWRRTRDCTCDLESRLLKLPLAKKPGHAPKKTV